MFIGDWNATLNQLQKIREKSGGNTQVSLTKFPLFKNVFMVKKGGADLQNQTVDQLEDSILHGRTDNSQSVSKEERRQGWIPVISSNVAAIRFEDGYPGPGTIFVRFKNGAVYSYPGKHKSEFDSFVAAASKGRFVWENLRADSLGRKSAGYIKAYGPDSRRRDTSGVTLEKTLKARDDRKAAKFRRFK